MTLMKNYFILCFALVVLWIMPASAGERTDLIFTNRLDEEIVSIRVKYATPYDEPRHHSSHVNLPPGAEDWRMGVQGTTLPEVIIFDLATKSYVFDNLYNLEPDGEMYLEAGYEDDSPVLRRTDSGDNLVIQGEERNYLTDANQPYAVDRDSLTDLTTWKEVAELVLKTIASLQGERLKPESETIDIEAGPIWSNDHAETRCPEAAAEWSEENGREARWNGNWRTTVPGKMSTCTCEAEAGEITEIPETVLTKIKETAFEENDGWGETVYFPVRWMDWIGVAKVQEMDKNNEDEGIGFDLCFRIPEGGTEKTEEMLDSLLGDLRVDGFRPWHFAMETWNEEKGERDTTDLVFHQSDGDKYDDQDAMQEILFAAYADGTLSEASVTWVQEETFDAAKAGEERQAAPGVMVMFSKGTFEAVFVPDGRMFFMQ